LYLRPRKNLKPIPVFAIKIDKEEILKLPVAAFRGQMTVVEYEEQLGPAFEELKHQRVLGFDTETRPAFKKGRVNKVALIQLAISDKAWLFRLNKIGYPKQLLDLLEDPEHLKIGVGLKDDIMRLNRLRPFQQQGFLDLATYVKAFGINDNGLRKLAANILGIRVSKAQQLANWEQDILTPAQLSYAATDAWVCYEMYKKLHYVQRERF